MKSIVLSSVVAALVVFSGCSSKEPVVDNKPVKQEVAHEVAPVETESISSENAGVESTTSTSSEVGEEEQPSMLDIQSDLSTVYFDFDKYNIRPDMQDIVSSDSSKLAKANALKYSVKLEGNCDDWGSDEYNFALGLRRANTIKKALVAEGVDAKRITMVSYGESNPVCTAQTKECWAKNRRVDFELLP